MKVLVFTSLYPNAEFPNQGVFIRERMANFARWSGHEVRVMAPVPYFPPIKGTARWKYSQVPRRETQGGIEVFHPRYLMTPNVGMMFYGVFMFLSVLAEAIRLRRNFDFDLIDSHFVYPDGLAGVLLGRYFRKPVTVSARGSDINLYKEFPLIRRLLRYTLGKADRVIAVSRALKATMVSLGVPDRKIIVIPNGVDANKFIPLPKMKARRDLGLPQQQIVLSVGHLTPVKGFDLLIQAMKILVKDRLYNDLFLVIVGEGPSRHKLEQLVLALGVNEHVLLAGEVSHHLLPTWYSAADIFCLASIREGWPNVLLESLSCGTPVLGTKVGGIPEIISSDKVGLIVDRSPEGIADAILVALGRCWSCDSLREHARQFTWEQVTESLSSVFKSVLPGCGNFVQEMPVEHD